MGVKGLKKSVKEALLCNLRRQEREANIEDFGGVGGTSNTSSTDLNLIILSWERMKKGLSKRIANSTSGGSNSQWTIENQ